MQDRFKFRGIHPVLGELQEVKFIDFINNTVDFGDGDIFKIADVKLMQCTGLKDKNGKLIYEGDIVIDSKGQYGKVFYHQSSTCYAINWKMKDGSYETDKCFEYGKVIGNIYENKELLNDRTDND